MLFFIAVVLGLVVAVFLEPASAWAWGPGVHLAIGNQLLTSPQILGPSLAGLLTANPQAFLYGALSADIFVGKGCQAKPGHSHNWETGISLLRDAASPDLRAYALGYASHLAADVIAHNFYVPNMLGITPGSGKLSHVLVEMQADRRVYWSRRQAKGLFRVPDAKEQDKFLVQTTQRNLWSFLLKKQLYKGSVHVAGSKDLRKPLSRLRRVLPVVPQLEPNDSGTKAASIILRNHDYLMTMLDLSLVLAREAVLQPEACLARTFDPIGSGNLAAVRQIRRNELQRRIIAPGKLFPLPPHLERFALDLKDLNGPHDLSELSDPGILQNVKTLREMQNNAATPDAPCC